MNTGLPGLAETAANPAADTVRATPVSGSVGAPEQIVYTVGILCDKRARWMNGIHLHMY